MQQGYLIKLNNIESSINPALIGKSSGRFVFADSLRGLAALWVVFFHASEGKHIEYIRDSIPTFFYKLLFDFGHLGVSMFFVLSGFVMALTLQNTTVNSKFAAKFILRRLVRLVPSYYFAIAFTLLLMLVKSNALHSQFIMVSMHDLWAHAFFLQDFLSITQINPVFWTLCIEVQFYIAFIFIIWIADQAEHLKVIRQGRLVIVTLSSTLALIWAFEIVKNPLWTGGFIVFWYSFLAGVLVCFALHENNLSRKVAYGYFLLLAMATIITHSMFTFTVLITSLLLTVAGIQGKMSQWLNWRWLQSVALISYSLYLLHNQITGATFNILKRVLPEGLLFEVVELIITIGLCVVFSWIAYMISERPSISWSHLISLREK